MNRTHARPSFVVTVLVALAIILSACGLSETELVADGAEGVAQDVVGQEESPEGAAENAESSEELVDEPVDADTAEPETAETAVLQEPIVIPNQGGSNEGHTPRGFQGMGTGLFAGDELNSNFPADDGVQIWLTFDLPADISGVSSARLVSDALTVRGNPFEALGNLQAAPVRYDAFGPSVVPLEPVGDTVTCDEPVGSLFTCNVLDAVQGEIEAGRDQVQLRLRFEGVSDPDGEQDLALFFLTDSNTNEPGIFQLELS